jgi:hypothetical protein
MRRTFCAGDRAGEDQPQTWPCARAASLTPRPTFNLLEPLPARLRTLTQRPPLDSHPPQAARQGKLDPVICRDEEIRRCVHILSRRTKNNPVLIGGLRVQIQMFQYKTLWATKGRACPRGRAPLVPPCATFPQSDPSLAVA